jgi:hypothetical protein
VQLNFTPEHEAQLSQIARYEGRNAEELAKAVLLRLIEDNRRHCEGVREGMPLPKRATLLRTKMYACG